MMWGDRVTEMEESSCQRSEEVAKPILTMVAEVIATSRELISKTMQWFQNSCQGRRAMKGWWTLTITRVHHLSNRETQMWCILVSCLPRRIKKSLWLPIEVLIFPELNLDHRARRLFSIMTQLHLLYHANKKAKVSLQSTTIQTTTHQAILKWLVRT